MANAVRWREQTRDDLGRILPEAVVVLPVGATEQHGPHLATGTDALLAETAVERAVELASALSSRALVVAPTVATGASDHHLPFGGTLSLRPETLLAVLLDLARSVAECGGRRLVFVNGHGGNRGICSAAAAAASTRADIAVGYLDYWSLAPGADPGGTPVPGHAGAFETSLVLAVAPQLVRDPAERPDPPAAPAVADLEIARQASWQEIDGFTDEPAGATVELGRAWLDRIAGALAERLVEFARTL